MTDANLANANLASAYVLQANLFRTNLIEAKEVPYLPYSCPDHGSFIGYKRVRDGYIVELEILSDAKRCSSTGRKCRCDKAKVLSIQEPDGTPTIIKEIPSYYDASFVYKVGKIVSVDNFDENRWNECSTGIHFFINRQEAVNYSNY